MLVVFPGADGIFQQDNAACHMARNVQHWLEEHGQDLQVLPCPTNSPDLNPTEHLWDHLDLSVPSVDPLPRTLPQLWDALKSWWLQIPVTTYQDFIESQVYFIYIKYLVIYNCTSKARNMVCLFKRNDHVASLRTSFGCLLLSQHLSILVSAGRWSWKDDKNVKVVEASKWLYEKALLVLFKTGYIKSKQTKDGQLLLTDSL